MFLGVRQREHLVSPGLDGGGQKNGRYIPYYVCSKRLNDHDCYQEYVRTELLESAIVEDIKAMFRNEAFMARVWEEANRWLGAEKPNIAKEIARIETEVAKVRGSLDRYFEAFEAGTLKAELCNQKVQDLHDWLEQLDTEKRKLEARRERLELPAIDRDMLTALVDNFEQVIAEGPNAQKKALLRRLVKRVLVHDRRTIEVWYALPNSRGFEDCHKNLPE
jgi:site-specific DNA recombinase